MHDRMLHCINELYIEKNVKTWCVRAHINKKTMTYVGNADWIRKG